MQRNVVLDFSTWERWSARLWIKNLTSLYNNIGEQLDGVLNASKMLPGWMKYALRTLQGEMRFIILDQFPALLLGGNS